MFKRLLVTAGPLLVAAAVPAALSLGGASAATMPLAGSMPTSALAPVTSLLSSTAASLFPASHHAAAPHAIVAPAGHAPVSHATGNGLKLSIPAAPAAYIPCCKAMAFQAAEAALHRL